MDQTQPPGPGFGPANGPHPDAPAPDPGLAGTVRFLKVLTGLLGATMILGLLAIVTLLVTRWPGASHAPAPTLPEELALPGGASPRAVTFGEGWIAVVTDRDEIVILDAGTGAVRQTIRLAP
jgi:hypothetical protein